ncbi:MAG TPA: prepilin-type N-terminal cleavage/methylation domain-containing protein [Aliidongia sp.]|nr:prepilin-type N-terminal cleavage/methylation domain-containing protein [Aliidongia sp.]
MRRRVLAAARRRTASPSGFTLLEVLIAFVIAAMALGIMFKAATGGLFAVATAGKYEEAMSRAKSHLAALGHDNPLTAGDFEGDDGSDFHWSIHVAQIATVKPSEQLLRTVPQIASRMPALYEVDVAISWTEGGRKRQVQLRSKRLDAPGGDNEG